MEREAKPALPEKSVSKAAKGPASPGLFLMKFVESRGLVCAGSRIVPGGAGGKDAAELPYAVIEMDKNEVLMRAVEGVPATGNAIWGTRAHLYCFADTATSVGPAK